MRDFVEIRELSARTVIGVHEHERREPQEVFLSLQLWTDAKRAAAEDRIESALDYEKVARRAIEIAEGARFRLIESLAEAVARACVTEFAVPRVRVRIDKPGALESAKAAGITIERDTSDYAK